jgi:Ca2+-binding EF-hand superfamily protein
MNAGARTGCLDASEILQLSAQLGHKLSAKELREAMAVIDEDGTGEVDFREFYKWWSRDDKAVMFSENRAQEYYTIVPL